MKYSYLFFFLFLSIPITAQNIFEGQVHFLDENNNKQPLEGANVYWEKSTIGTLTDSEGKFNLPITENFKVLVISYLGFDTIKRHIHNDDFQLFLLTSKINDQLEEVIVSKRKKAIQKSYFETQNIVTVNSAELLKAACCNLSESFETNPSIDVNFSDALTGTKQIKMLGLSSPYLLITEENIPMVRGASQAYGLSFTPGTWVESIQITKGTGSVINGFESMAGQINTELLKPFNQPRLFFNAYSSVNGRNELNIQFSDSISKKWSTGIFVHGNQRSQQNDKNNDNFSDNPLSKQINLLNRWQYIDSEKGWVGFANIRFMDDHKQLGSISFDPSLHKNSQLFWGSEIDTKRLDSSLKIGYVFPELPYQSIGFQMSYSQHNQESYFGLNAYDIHHQSFYASFLFNSIIGNTKSKFKAGINFMNDAYDEMVVSKRYKRTDYSLGGYFEYSYDNLDNFSLVAGIRVDNHNSLGTFLTPRFHARYVLAEKNIFRVSVGSGRKIANIFAENQPLFATSRVINIHSQSKGVFGLNPEKSWNYGFSYRRIFDLFSRPGDVTIDYYETHFQNQVVVDWENYREIAFYNLNGKSYSKSLQVSLDYTLWDNLDLRLAYKNYDVKTQYNDGLKQRPLLAKNRFFGNLSYETFPNNNNALWRFDTTYHQVGKQRLPNTVIYNNEFSDSYSLWNAQITRVFSNRFEIYIGGENLGNYKQPHPIVDADNPFGPNFDSSLVYGPIFGRNLYAGLRYTIL